MEWQAVFDFHARLGTGRDALGRLLSTMDHHGIDRAAVCAGGVVDPYRLSAQIVQGGYVEADADNDTVLAACQRSGGRLTPFFLANPHRDPIGYAGQAGGFRGLEISPAIHGIALTDERTIALIEVAAKFRHPVYVVCLGRPGAAAQDLVAIAAKFPEVTFILGHCGFIGIDFDAISTIASSGNILAETSGCYTSVAVAALDRLGAGRVLFGTEYPVQHPSVELAKLRALQLPAPQWRQVAWDNAHRVLEGELT